MKILVTIPNKRKENFQFASPHTFLYKVNLATKQVDEIFIPEFIALNMVGLTGITKIQGDYFVLVQKYDSFLARLDKNFRVKQLIGLKKVKGGHDLKVLDRNHILIASTGTNRIIKFNIHTLVETDYFVAEDSTKDLIHLNSILSYGGNLYYSAFGPKKDNWIFSMNGCIKGVSEHKIYYSKLYQPHTLLAENGTIYFCESAKSCIRSLSGEVFDLGGGYVRGLAINKNTMIVGTSKVRTISYSSGNKVSFSDFREAGSCKIKIFQKNKNLADSVLNYEIDMSSHGNEIYDILFLK